MENNTKIIHTPLPLPLERIEKLKIFAISAIKKDIPEYLYKEKTGLAVAVCYSELEALQAVHETLKHLGKNPEDYKTPLQIVSIEADRCIVGSLKQPIKQITDVVNNTENPIESKKEKSKLDMITYVRYIFNEVATIEEITIANKVIEKFKQIK